MDTAIEIPINPIYINAFLDSVQNVFSTMLNLKVEAEGLFVKAKPYPAYDISGVVGFTGELAGSMTLSFSEDVAVKVVEAMTYEKMDVDSDDFVDAVGELANMVAGNAKKDFGLDASIGIPIVTVGAKHSFARLSDVPCIIVPCSCDAGDFTIEINIKKI